MGEFLIDLWGELSLGVNSQNNRPMAQDMGGGPYRTELSSAGSHLIRGKGEGPAL